jgi:hypothetical protein
VDQAREKARELLARNHLKGTGDDPLGVGDGDPGADLAQVEGSDPPGKMFWIGQGAATPGRRADGPGSPAPS